NRDISVQPRMMACAPLAARRSMIARYCTRETSFTISLARITGMVVSNERPLHTLARSADSVYAALQRKPPRVPAAWRPRDKHGQGFLSNADQAKVWVLPRPLLAVLSAHGCLQSRRGE